MANKDAAFGMRPVGRIGGTPYTGGLSRYRIAANYDTAIFQGDMVAQVTGGGVEVHADGGTVPIVGVFQGCSYTDPTTKEQVYKNYYPASTNTSDIFAYVIDDPNVLFEAQEDSTDIGSSWPDNRGSNANFVSTHSGSTKTGRSKQELDSSDIGATAANFRIVELSKDPDNSDTTAANCNFLVRLNEGLYYSNTAGI